jgi:hypothetical protein
MIRLITIIFGCIYGQAIACTCAEKETVKKSYENYPLIFHGRVIDKSVVLSSTTQKDGQLKTKLKGGKKKLSRLENQNIQSVTFEVIEIFKGDTIANTVIIFTDFNTSCDIDFQKNKDYLVYATKRDFNNNSTLRYAESKVEIKKEGLYWTHYCTRTRPFDDQEKKELIELKNG